MKEFVLKFFVCQISDFKLIFVRGWVIEVVNKQEYFLYCCILSGYKGLVNNNKVFMFYE